MASKPDIWMPLYIGDYLADTAHLDAQRSGAYLHLLMHYWRKGALVNDLALLGEIAKLRGSDAPSIVQALLNDFFSLSDDGLWHQSRADKLREEWQGKKDKAAEKAALAANARWNKDAPSNASSNAQSNAQAMLEPCPLSLSLSLPKEQEQKPTPSAFLLPEWVDRDAWQGFEEMRKKIRKPLTNRARDGIIRNLQKLCPAGDNGAAVLDQSTQNGWSGVFELRTSNKFKQNGAFHGKGDANIQALRESIAEDSDQGWSVEYGNGEKHSHRQIDIGSLLGTSGKASS